MLLQKSPGTHGACKGSAKNACQDKKKNYSLSDQVFVTGVAVPYPGQQSGLEELGKLLPRRHYYLSDKQTAIDSDSEQPEQLLPEHSLHSFDGEPKSADLHRCRPGRRHRRRLTAWRSQTSEQSTPPGRPGKQTCVI